MIDRVTVTKNEQLLAAIESIFDSTQVEEKLPLKSIQIEMLMMSENDIEKKNLISESDLNEADSEWMC